MLEGLTAGFILSITLFPGAVWLAKVGVFGDAKQVCAVSGAFALSQFIWLLVAIPGLMLMMLQLHFIRTGMHLFAAFALFFMSIKFFRSRRADRLDDVRELPGLWVLFRTSFNQSLAIPMRLPVAMAILMATGVYVNHTPSWWLVPYVLAGALVGVAWWWGQLAFLAIFFAKRVPLHMTLRSLNKIRPFCGVLYLCLSVIVLFFAFGG